MQAWLIIFMLFTSCIQELPQLSGCELQQVLHTQHLGGLGKSVITAVPLDWFYAAPGFEEELCISFCRQLLQLLHTGSTSPWLAHPGRRPDTAARSWTRATLKHT